MKVETSDSISEVLIFLFIDGVIAEVIPELVELTEVVMAEVALEEYTFTEETMADDVVTEGRLTEDTMADGILTEGLLAEETPIVDETEPFAFNSNSAIRTCNNNSFSRASSTAICSLSSFNSFGAEAEVVRANAAGTAKTNGTSKGDDEHVGTRIDSSSEEQSISPNVIPSCGKMCGIGVRIAWLAITFVSPEENNGLYGINTGALVEGGRQIDSGDDAMHNGCCEIRTEDDAMVVGGDAITVSSEVVAEGIINVALIDPFGICGDSA